MIEAVAAGLIMGMIAKKLGMAEDAHEAAAESLYQGELMVRLTRRLFSDLAIWMTGLGLFIGVVFPFVVVLTISRSPLPFHTGWMPHSAPLTRCLPVILSSIF